jgi:hypothetical protein
VGVDSLTYYYDDFSEETELERRRVVRGSTGRGRPLDERVQLADLLRTSRWSFIKLASRVRSSWEAGFGQYLGRAFLPRSDSLRP